jgi:hypothetical protein
MKLVILGQAMMAAPMLLPLVFAIAFASFMIILVIGSWLARLMGFIKGNQPELPKKMVRISLLLASAFCLFSIWRLSTVELIN